MLDDANAKSVLPELPPRTSETERDRCDREANLQEYRSNLSKTVSQMIDFIIAEDLKYWITLYISDSISQQFGIVNIDIN